MQITEYPFIDDAAKGYFDGYHPRHLNMEFTEFCEYIMGKCKPATDKRWGGAFLGGFDRGGHSYNTVTSRSMVTLDLDMKDAEATTQQEVANRIRDRLGQYEYFAYTTYNSNPDNPRFRILLPLQSTLMASDPGYDMKDAYTATVFMLAIMLNPEWLDGTCARATQCMYMPLRRADGPEIEHFYNRGAKVLPVTNKGQIREICASFAEINPKQANVASGGNGEAVKIEDPLTKKGWVGAFNRTYRISEAIEKFCSDYYTPDITGRYTWVNGSQGGGVVTYQDDTIVYSFNNTAPISDGHAHNAFDLVRLTLFSALDAGQHPNTKPENLNSYKAMVDFCQKDPEVVKQRETDRAQELRECFSFDELAEDTDFTWMDSLRTVGRGDNKKWDKNPGNVVAFLKNWPTLKGRIRYDEFTQRKIAHDLPWDPQEHDWSDYDTANTRVYLDGIMERAAAKDIILDAIEKTAHDNSYDALMDYINGLPKWDGVPRVDTLLIDYLGAKDDPAGYTRMVTRKHMVAHIARALVPGCKYDVMLILKGPQGCGKTKFIGNLAPNEDWYQNEMPPIKDKDSDAKMVLAGKWIMESAELVAFKKSDQEALKNFLSLRKDNYRKPYGREFEKQPRRVVIWGSTNQNEFLRDSTGERRYWPVACMEQEKVKLVDIDLPLERDQIWAEALHYYQEKEPIFLDEQQEELLKQVQEAFKETDPELLQAIDFLEIEIPTPEIWNKLTRTQKQEYYAGNLITGGNSVLAENVPEITAKVPRETITPRELWCECFGKDENDYKRSENRRMQEILDNVPGWKRVSSKRRICGYKVDQDRCYYRSIHNDDTNIDDLL